MRTRPPTHLHRDAVGADEGGGAALRGRLELLHELVGLVVQVQEGCLACFCWLCIEGWAG